MLETIFEDGEVVEDDVEMLDVEADDVVYDNRAGAPRGVSKRELGVRDGGNRHRRFKKKKKKKKKRAPSDVRVTDINKCVF